MDAGVGPFWRDRRRKGFGRGCRVVWAIADNAHYVRLRVRYLRDSQSRQNRVSSVRSPETQSVSNPERPPARVPFRIEITYAENPVGRGGRGFATVSDRADRAVIDVDESDSRRDEQRPPHSLLAECCSSSDRRSCP